MCGGTAQTTQQVSIPPDVLARYNAVNARAEQVAQKPFQQYSTDPNAFVAPINQTQQAAISNIGGAQNIAQPYFQGATEQLMGAQGAATPYYGQATQQLMGGLAAGMTGTQAAYQPMAQAAQYAQGLQGGALGQYQGALQAAQPFNQAAAQYAQTGLAAAAPYYGQAAQNITGAQDIGGALGGASLNALQQAGQAAQPLQAGAAENITSAAAAAEPLNQAAIRNIMQGNRAAQPLQQQAAAGLGAAQAGAQPYQQLATQYGLSGARAVNAGPLGGEQINQYMSPYLGSVVDTTMRNLRQQQGQEQSSLLGNQIAQGAFGGDRGRIAQANLARQQEMATGQTVANLMNQGYGQALATAQQQQQLGLGAEQANRAAQQQAAQQMLGIGQQGFGQGLATAQQQAALGQQLYGQGLGTGQALAGIGQQRYGQQLGTGQAQAALGQQLFGQGATTAAQQAALGQQLYGQGMGAAQAQQALGQGLYGMGTGMGGFMQGLGQQNYAQQTGLGQNMAALAQQGFGQGAAQTAQQAALAQQQYGMGAGAAGQLAGLGQGLYGMGAGTSQALAGLGTQAQQNALGAAQAQLGAGTVQQQTEQAGKQALYNQFLQQQGYDFQTAQFLANIAMGTGALSGSTTATTQPMPFFSAKRLKEAVEPIGETYDGQKIVKFRYKNEPGTRIGLIAQDVEKHHPDAVGLAGGYKTVDYDAATKDAAAKGHYARGGLAPESEGGAVLPFPMRRGFALGGNPAQLVGNDELAAILQAQFGMYGNQGIPGLGGTPGAQGFVPAGSLPVGNLTVAGDAPELPKDEASSVIEKAKGVVDAYKGGREAVNEIRSWFDDKPKKEASGGLVGHYASGGASMGPYGIPINTGDTPDLITAGKPPKPPKSGFETMMDTVASIGGLANHIKESKAAGGAAEGEDVGSGTPYEAGKNPYMPKSAESVQKGKELAKPGEAPDAPESGFSQAMHFAKDVGSIAALASFLNRGGRVGKQVGGSLEEEENLHPTSSTVPTPIPVEKRELPIPGAYSTLSPAEKAALNATLEAQLNAAQKNKPAENTIEQQRPVSQGLAAPVEASSNVQQSQGLGQVNASKPNASTLSNPYSIVYKDLVKGEEGPLARADQPPPTSLGPFSKTERWLIPFLAGLGTMASSRNRYGLGAALEGVGGAASAYGNMQMGQYEKGQAQQKLGAEAFGQTTSRLLQINEARRLDLEQLRLTISNLVQQYDPATKQTVWVNRFSGEKLTSEQRDAIIQKMNSLSGSSFGDMGLPSVPRATGEGSLQAAPSNVPIGTEPTMPSKPPVSAVPSVAKEPVKRANQSVSIPASEGVPSVASVPVSSVPIDETVLPEQFRPSVINKNILNAQNAIKDINSHTELDPAIRQAQIQEQQNIIENQQNNQNALYSGNVTDLSGRPYLQAQVLKNQAQKNAETHQDLPQVFPNIEQQKQGLGNVANVLSKYSSGAYSAFRSQASQFVGTGEEAGARQILNKEQINSIINQMNASDKTIGSGIGVMNTVEEGTFGPDLQPYANKKLLSQLMGRANFLDALAKAKQSAYQVDPSYDQTKFVSDWTKANPLQKFVNEAYKTVPVLGASPRFGDVPAWEREASEHGTGGIYILPKDQTGRSEDIKVRLIRKNNGQLSFEPVR